MRRFRLKTEEEREAEREADKPWRELEERILRKDITKHDALFAVEDLLDLKPEQSVRYHDMIERAQPGEFVLVERQQERYHGKRDAVLSNYDGILFANDKRYNFGKIKEDIGLTTSIMPRLGAAMGWSTTLYVSFPTGLCLEYDTRNSLTNWKESRNGNHFDTKIEFSAKDLQRLGNRIPDRSVEPYQVGKGLVNSFDAYIGQEAVEKLDQIFNMSPEQVFNQSTIYSLNRVFERMRERKKEEVNQ
jgi:hypothetical protein|tara:strand:- start:243 stop:980 length:738 start_codon:yes stop_codon:yes gene_type:complete